MASVTVPSTGPSGPVTRTGRGRATATSGGVPSGAPYAMSANHRATRSPRSAGPADVSVGSSTAAANPRRYCSPSHA